MNINCNFSGQTTPVRANKVNFGATKMDSVKLLKRVAADKFEPIKANILELDYNNAKDKDIISNILEQWGKGIRYLNIIASNFKAKQEDSRYFVTEVINNGQKRYTNIMQTSIAKANDDLNVEFLQSAPDIANKVDFSTIKGSGATALCEAAKIARDNRCGRLFLYSTNNNFYDKMGLNNFGEIDGIAMYTLEPDNYDSFINKVSQKYAFDK